MSLYLPFSEVQIFHIYTVITTKNSIDRYASDALVLLPILYTNHTLLIRQYIMVDRKFLDSIKLFKLFQHCLYILNKLLALNNFILIQLRFQFNKIKDQYKFQM